MALATVADYLASLRQRVRIRKDGGTSQSQTWNSNFISDNGDPMAGAASIGNITSGIVPTATTLGCPAIQPFSGTGYLTGVELTVSNISTTFYVGTFLLYDRLFHAGTFPRPVGTTTLTGQPSFASRIPGGTDYRGLQIWAESAVASGSGVNVCHVTYTNQDGVTGCVSGTATKPNNVTCAMVHMALAPGDSGVQAIESYVVEADPGGNSGQFNIVIVRPLCMIRVGVTNKEVRKFFDQTHMPQVWPDSALCVMSRVEAINGTIPFDMSIEIASR